MSDFSPSDNQSDEKRITLSSLPVYSLETAADMTGVHRDLLIYYCQLRLLGNQRARTEAEPTFDDQALYEVRRIEHFRREFGITRSALPMLWELLHEVERLQREVRFLRHRQG